MLINDSIVRCVALCPDVLLSCVGPGWLLWSIRSGRTEDWTTWQPLWGWTGLSIICILSEILVLYSFTIAEYFVLFFYCLVTWLWPKCCLSSYFRFCFNLCITVCVFSKSILFFVFCFFAVLLESSRRQHKPWLLSAMWPSCLQRKAAAGAPHSSQLWLKKRKRPGRGSYKVQLFPLQF